MARQPTKYPTQLFPEIEPYYHKYLPVGGGHTIYYEECGNRRGYPVIFFHGGPGGGCSEKDRRYFDPRKWRIFLINQRGCEKTGYRDRLQDNNTFLLTDDVATIMSARKIDKAVIVGPSWGSCLASVFAIRYPKLISGIVENGIFLGTKEEIDYFYNGSIAQFRPQAWERFISHVPKDWQKLPLQYYRSRIFSGDPEKRGLYLYEFCLFEMALLHLRLPNLRNLEKNFSYPLAKALVRLEIHYFINNCFLPDNYILDNASKIADIPTSLVQGIYDLICPPIGAHKLHKALPNSTLHLVTAGHARSDPAMRRALLREIDKMYDVVTGAA